MKKITLLILFILLSLNYSQAQTHKRDSLKALIKTEKRDTQKVNLLCGLAFTYSTNSPDTAIKIALEALTLANRIHFIKGQALSFNRIGNSYQSTSNYAKAMEVFLRALKLNESINNLGGIAQNTINLGSCYSNVGEYDKALTCIHKAKKLYEVTGDGGGMALCLTALGTIYLKTNRYDSARVYAQLGYEAYKKSEPRRLGDALSLQGDIYKATGELKLSLEYYHLSMPFYKKQQNYKAISAVFLDIAKIFEAERLPDSATLYAKKAYSVGSQLGKYSQVLANASSYLANMFDKQKAPDSASFYYRAAAVAKYSLYSQQRFSQFQSLGFDEQLRQIELANTEEKAAEERRHNLQFAAMAVGILSLLIVFFALSRTIIVQEKFIEYFNVVALLAVFEFINLLIHPYLARLTHDSPPLMLLILIGIGALLVPLHHKLEHWIAHVLTEKNKQIRLAAAKKTIAHLEGSKTE